MQKHPIFTSSGKLLLTLLSFYVVSGCGKMGSHGLRVDLKVTSSVTGLPIKSHVYAEYMVSSFFAQATTKKIDLGTTDENGLLEIRRNMGRQASDVKLLIYGQGQYSNIWADGLSSTEKAPLGEKYKLNAKLKPNYHYLLSVTNTSCFDETDTVWFDCTEQYTADYRWTGCESTVFRFGNNLLHDFSFWVMTPTITFDITVKRNGSINTFQQTFNLQENVVTPIQIDY